MTTATQDAQFVDQVIPRTLLEESIAWLRKHMDVEELVGIESLKEYVNGYVDLEDIISPDKLRDWALANGFKEEED